MELRISSVWDGVFGLLSSTGGSFFGTFDLSVCFVVLEASVLETNTGLSYLTRDCPGVIKTRRF